MRLLARFRAWRESRRAASFVRRNRAVAVVPTPAPTPTPTKLTGDALRDAMARAMRQDGSTNITFDNEGHPNVARIDNVDSNEKSSRLTVSVVNNPLALRDSVQYASANMSRLDITEQLERLRRELQFEKVARQRAEHDLAKLRRELHPVDSNG